MRGVFLALALCAVAGALPARQLFAPPPQPLPRPPSSATQAQVARWIVSQAQFGMMATTSCGSGGRPKGLAMSNVASVSDGVHSDVAAGNSTGVPLLYITAMDPTGADLAVNPAGSIGFTQAYGKDGGFPAAAACKEPENPTCARLTLMGSWELVSAPAAKAAAKKALFSKHPQMASWPGGHGWLVYRLKIDYIFLLSNYGGTAPIKVAEYLAATP